MLNWNIPACPCFGRVIGPSQGRWLLSLLFSCPSCYVVMFSLSLFSLSLPLVCRIAVICLKVPTTHDFQSVIKFRKIQGMQPARCPFFKALFMQECYFYKSLPLTPPPVNLHTHTHTHTRTHTHTFLRFPSTMNVKNTNVELIKRWQQNSGKLALEWER